jgi:hypothetical protein
MSRCLDCATLRADSPTRADVQGCQPARVMALLIALADSMREEYPQRLPIDDPPIRLRSLAVRPADDLVAGVMSAGTTEARVYLAKALALALDWRLGHAPQGGIRAEQVARAAPQRPRQDSNLRPAD